LDRARTCTNPARFWPKSAVNTPGAVSTIFTGWRGSSIRTGGASFARRRAGAASSKRIAGRQSSESSFEASYVSPW
jgi:hypothetical protein